MSRMKRLISVLTMVMLLFSSVALAEVPTEEGVLGAVAEAPVNEEPVQELTEEITVTEEETTAEEEQTTEEALVAEEIPESAVIIGSLVDQLDPNRRIDIYADWEGDDLYLGSEVVLYAKLHGYENAVYTLQWQESADDKEWSDIEGATDVKLELVLDENNWANFWRVAVIITDVTTN